jgi:hypothetical protein
VLFDSGFHYSQIEPVPGRIDISFNAYVIEEAPDLYKSFLERSMVVFPIDRLLQKMVFYWGISRVPYTEWRNATMPESIPHIKEKPSQIGEARLFDVRYCVDIPGDVRRGEHFSCSVACEETSVIFDNKRPELLLLA